MIKLYDIQFDDTFGDDVTNHMYYRGGNLIVEGQIGERVLKEKENYDFFTYFNSLSIGKWRKYTNLKKYELSMEIEGEFDLYVFGHYLISTGAIKKEYYQKKRYRTDGKEIIKVAFPDKMKGTVVGFSIYTHKETKIYSAYYSADESQANCNDVRIALSTTTFAKEEYVFNNIRLLKNELFSNPEYSEHFHWYIVDNGRTIDTALSDKQITIIPNPNVGGAGGFARGMMESIKDGGFTHVLLMDDDVCVKSDSFIRLFLLLTYLKNEYKGRFVSGAMLKMGEPNVQHEDVGVLDISGRHHPEKPMFDLNLWDSIVKNESYIYEDEKHYYAAWWFCCIPSKYVRDDNLPLPVFVRGDDVEYSLRNKPGFISMNGICIWHEGFEGKFSGALEFYQVSRNELIVQQLHDELSDVDILGRIEQFFWEEIYKFNYKGAALLLDAIDDYLKGPEYVFSLDGSKVMKDKKRADNQPEKLTETIERLVPKEGLYDWKPLKGIKKVIYDYSYNGQARIPGWLTLNSYGIIPYGWEWYMQFRMCLVKEIYAVDTLNKTYVTYKKDREEFKRLKKRHELLMKRLKRENEQVVSKYRDAFSVETSSDRWYQRTCFK